MGSMDSVNKMKVPELKALCKDAGLQVTGKEKKNELLTLIENAVGNKLGQMTNGDLAAFAAEIQVAVPEGMPASEIITLVTQRMGPGPLRKLLGCPDGEPLEEIGEELVDIAKDMEKTIQNLEEHHTPDMADIYLIDQKLTDVVKMNIDYANVASMLDVGRIKFLDRKYVESMTMLSEALKASDDMINLYNDITQAFIILSAEKILEECRDSKSNDEAAADVLISAKRSFSSRGKNRVDSVKALSDIAKKVHREEVVYLEQRMAFVEPLINAMKVQGVDVFNAERYIHRAREAFLIGELSSVATYLDKSLNMANDSKQIWIQEIRNDIPRVESILHQASELGADISTAEKHLSQAKTAFDNEDYSLCSELKKQAERKAMESQQSQIQKAAKLEREKLGDAEKIVNALEPLMKEARLYGINTMDVNTAIQSARNALMNNDYVNSLTYARDAESLSKPVWTQVKAHREAILSSREPLQQCQTCNAMAVKVIQPGRAVCANCGKVYEFQTREPEQQKKGWFRK